MFGHAGGTPLGTTQDVKFLSCGDGQLIGNMRDALDLCHRSRVAGAEQYDDVVLDVDARGGLNEEIGELAILRGHER